MLVSYHLSELSLYQEDSGLPVALMRPNLLSLYGNVMTGEVPYRNVTVVAGFVVTMTCVI